MNKLIVFAMAFFLSPVSFAGVVYPFSPEGASISVDTYANGVNCFKSAMTIEGMTNLTDLSEPVPPAVNATDCYAVKSPDNDFASTYEPNTGDLYDGMFNGESKSFNDPNNPGTKIDYHVDPNLFLDHANDQWVDESTPGWISLASIGVSGGEDETPLSFNVDYSDIGPQGDSYNLDGLLDITFGIDDGMGFWSLGFDADAADIIDEIEELLGRPTRFDHLSFVFKGANNEDWYLYDFSFWDLIDDGLNIDLNDPHFMFGTWNPTLFFNGKNVSHIEIVAHDPPPPSEITEPQSSVIFTLGLLLLALRYKMKV